MEIRSLFSSYTIRKLHITLITLQKMPKINKNKTEQARNRVRLFRGVQSILKSERNVDRMNNLNQNKYNTMAKNVSSSSFVSQKSLADQLKMWVLQYNLTQRAVTELLKILKSCGVKHLMSDARTLMKTPRIIQIPFLHSIDECKEYNVQNVQ